MRFEITMQGVRNVRPAVLLTILQQKFTFSLSPTVVLRQYYYKMFQINNDLKILLLFLCVIT